MDVKVLDFDFDFDLAAAVPKCSGKEFREATYSCPD